MRTTAIEFLDFIKGKRVGFIGAGVSHLELIEQYSRLGAQVSVRDRRTAGQMGDTGRKLEQLGVKLVLGENYLDGIDEDILLRTPGMRYYTPQLTEARERGTIVTSEMELFFDLCPCKIFAVTGSDGKTTSAALIAEILKASGKNVLLGGNIGTPLLPRILEIKPTDIAVVELSSFQLISMREGPDVALITNISPNHLDMHRDMQEYINSKRNILLYQTAFSRSVLNCDNEITAAMHSDVRGSLYGFSASGRVQRGTWLAENGDIIFSVDGSDRIIMNKSQILIPGMHNVENFLGVISAVQGFVPDEAIVQVAQSFTGVEHRIEFVRELDGVRWYNDSIATSPTRAIAGLNAFDRRMIIIAGGYDKKIPFAPLADPVAKHVKLLILTGPTAPAIEEAVRSGDRFDSSKTKILRARDMADAVEIAHKRAVQGDIVSLSPACASFDAYPNFEARGRHFKELVKAL